jgi:hypothetical protein
MLGLFDGQDMLFQTSDWTVVTLARFFWRYGMDIYNIRNWVNDKMMTPFSRLVGSTTS